MKKLLLITLMMAAATAAASAQMMNKLTPAEHKEDYKLLFNGTTTNGWHVYNGHDAGAWSVVDGALQVDTAAKEQGDLITDKEYKNFELKIDWKISVGGNSGILFSVHEDTSLEYTFITGMEMQVLDDKNAEDNKKPDHLAGSLYDMIAPAYHAKPAGEWNSVIIKKLNGHLTLYMNGRKTVEVQMGSREWNELLQKSKFTKWKTFATYPTGHIALQDHTGVVAFRNIRIKQL